SAFHGTQPALAQLQDHRYVALYRFRADIQAPRDRPVAHVLGDVQQEHPAIAWRQIQLINTALRRKPSGKTHWSRRSLAEQTGLSKSTVHRYLTLFGLQPHRSKSFKLSNDPFF